MKQTHTDLSLGELCRLERGVSPTLKTEPGPYPLVVTASYRRSSPEFQFDEPAVCIPLISSTGHGNAALHRVHYQDGRFALANLLVAAIPRPGAPIVAKFLWRYLSAVKNRKLVPLMQGTANVSLKESDLLSVTVPCPPVAEQQRIVGHLDAIEDRLTRAQHLREEQEQELQAVLRSAFHQLEAHAEWVAMGDVAPVHRRPKDIELDGEYPELGARSFGKGIFHKPTLSGESLTWQKLFQVHAGDIVISNIKAWEGAIAVAGESDHGRYGSHRYLTCVVDPHRALPGFICFYLLSQSGLEQVGLASPGSADRNRTLAVDRLEKIKVPIVPLATQVEFQKLLNLRARLRSEAVQSEQRTAALLPSLLDRVFTT
jgi:type I restriction enzyme, S subunit